MIVLMRMVIVTMMIVLAVLVMHMPGLAVRRAEELRLQGDDAIQIEPAPAKDRLQRHIGALGPMDRGQRVEPSQTALDHGQIRRRHEIGLVEHDLVGEGDLLARLAALREAEEDVLGVDHGGH